MALSDKIKEKISQEVIRTLVSRFESFPTDASSNRNAPFHEAFLKAFSDKIEGRVSDIPYFISLSSWLQGLNTTLGQTFFENIAHHLSQGEKREYTSKKPLGNLRITKSQKDKITQIITDLSNSTKEPNLEYENRAIYYSTVEPFIKAGDFSVDVFIEDENVITAIELKSVKPNSGEMKGEKSKILEGKAALSLAFPSKRIEFFIGFPFDPTVNPEKEARTAHNKARFLKSIINMTKYFAADETLVASELWDLLSQQSNTMEQILKIINSIASPEFMEKYQYINSNENRGTDRYVELLRKWYLVSEIELIVNDDRICREISGNKRLTRIYNKHAFDAKAKYNNDRYIELSKLI
ncbi:MAG: TdeIII family type II restriction endonuclease [Candidatus Cloacimonetes bacterium]|nr:TdeIII family type II restriction endonuclease [Candidatus Cloacimonadota bacterium]